MSDEDEAITGGSISRPKALSLLSVGGVGLGAGCSMVRLDRIADDGQTYDPPETRAELATTVPPEPPETDDPKVRQCLENDAYGTIQSDAGAGTVSLWHARTDAGAELLETVQNRFNNQTVHTLETSQIPNSVYGPKLRSAIPSGDGPYLFEWAHHRVSRLGALVSDQTGRLDIPNCMLTDKALEASRFDGKRFGVPWAAETVALLYNESMIDSPPETYDEWLSIMDEHSDPENGQYGLGIPVNGYYLSGFAQAYGEEIYTGETGETGIDTDEVKKGLRLVTDNLAQYMPDDPSSSGQRSTFTDGDAPFLISGPWEAAGLQYNDGVDLGVTTVPDLPDGGTFRPFTGIKMLYFATKMDTGSAAGAARDYAEWFASNEALLLEHANRGNFVPVHTELLDSEALPEHIRGFADQVETGYTIPQSAEMKQVWGPFGDALTATFDGDGELGENLDAAAEEIRTARDGM